MLQLAGGLILGVALWLRHDPKTSNLLQLEFDGAQAPNSFYISTYSPLALTLMYLLKVLHQFDLILMDLGLNQPVTSQ